MDTQSYTPNLNSQKYFPFVSSSSSSGASVASCPIDMPIKMSNQDECLNSFKSTNNRVSLDGGYESLLSTSNNSSGFYLNSFIHNNNNGLLLSGSRQSHNHNHNLISSSASSISCGSSTNGHTSDNYSDDSNGAIFSQPCTPVKSQHAPQSSSSVFYGCNLARTPDHKNEMVADVSSYYFASIRASANKTLNETTTIQQQQQQHSNFSHYSASNSNSPIKFNYTCQSPKFMPHADHYVNHRDGLTSKLLRSPAFKLNQSPARFNFPPSFSEQQQPPVIKSFSSRFEAFNTQRKPTITPTEEEFMELLFKNNHLPMNPEFLIGRHMGIEQLDIIAELNKRSMQNVIDKIFTNVMQKSMNNLVRASGVNKEWRDVIKQNKVLNKKRIEFLKENKRIYDKFKENRRSKSNVLLGSLSWADKKNLYKNQVRARSSMNEASVDSTMNDGESSLVAPMMLIDMNCINQISDSFSLKNTSNNNSSSSLLWPGSFSSSMKLDSFDKDSQMTVDDGDVEPKTEYKNELERFRTSFKSEINKTNNSVLSCIGNTSASQLDINKFRVI